MSKYIAGLSYGNTIPSIAARQGFRSYLDREETQPKELLDAIERHPKRYGPGGVRDDLLDLQQLYLDFEVSAAYVREYIKVFNY